MYATNSTIKPAQEAKETGFFVDDIRFRELESVPRVQSQASIRKLASANLFSPQLYGRSMVPYNTPTMVTGIVPVTGTIPLETVTVLALDCESSKQTPSQILLSGSLL